MKRVLVLLAGIMLCSNAFTQNSADYKAFIKERKAVQKMVKEERNEKVSKDARKEAKAYAKEGWKAPAGALPLEKQLEKLYQMLFEYDLENGMPKYVKGGGRAISTSYDAAKMQAMAHARTDLAGNIQTEVVGIINDKNVTKELGKGDAVAFNESVQASKQFITQSIGRVITHCGTRGRIYVLDSPADSHRLLHSTPSAPPL